jgi:hypothetical protein
MLVRPFTHILVLSGTSWGDAEKLALQFAVAIKEKSGADAPLLICTDGSDRSVVHSFPRDIRVIYLDDLGSYFDPSERITLLTRLALQAGPQVFHNFDSRVGWLSLRRYHRQLHACYSRLYAYVPPYQMDQEGIPFGPAIELLNGCIDNLDGVILNVGDSQFASDLSRRFGFEKVNRDKLIVPEARLEQTVKLDNYW